MSSLLAQMTAQIAQWDQTGDRRAIFLACYQRMTEHMVAAVDRGAFHDAVWVRRLIDDFGAYYFAALAAWEDQRQGPLVWQYAFAYAEQSAALAVQHLLLGVNAHINYDLALVLDDLLRPEWGRLAEAQQNQRRADYDAVNQIIGLTIDRVQDEVIARYARTMRLIDKTLGPLDEWCTARLIRNWRDDVWRQAMATIVISDETERQAAYRRIDQLALARARLLSGDAVQARVFGYPLRWLSRLRLL